MKRAIPMSLGGFLAASALVLGSAASASAADLPTAITFTSEAATTATFGSDWELPVRVSSKQEGVTNIVSASDGTVDFLVAGKPGAYVAGAKIYAGGVAYFTQPSNVEPLGVGEYTVTAVFTPAPGSEFATSKTKKSVMLTITALGITPTVTIIDDPATVAVPTVRTSIAGTYVDENGAPPAGAWTVTTTDSNGSEVFTVTAAQPTEAEEGSVGVFDIPIDAELEPGETFTVTAAFVPDASIAPGIEFEDAPPATFTTRALTPSEVLSSPVDVSLWVAGLNGFLFIALVVGLIWLIGAWWRGRKPREKVTTVEESAASTKSIEGVPAPAAIGAGSTDDETVSIP